MIWGDFNHEIKNQNSIFKEYGMKWSSFKYTRPQSNSELDLIATSFEKVIFNKEYKDFMSDHECLGATIECNKERLKDLLEKKMSKKSHENISIESIKWMLQTSHSWKELRNQVLDNIKLSMPTLKYSPKYISIWSKIIRGDITVMNIRQKIQKAMKRLNSDKTPSSELWNISKQLNEDLKKKESSFLLGIEEDGEQIYNIHKIRKTVSKYYNRKFKDEIENEHNNQTILNLFEDYELKNHYHDLIIEGITKEMEKFPVNTTYGPDLIIPKNLKVEEFRIELKQFICKNISCNNRMIPEESLIGRLILLTKTGSPISKVEKTRPIIVQTLMIRLIEKVIKTKLEEWNKCHNFNSDSYQWGFQKKNSTVVNLIRAKAFLKNNKKKRNKNKPIVFALDIEGAFDNIPRKIILEAIKWKIEKWQEWKSRQRLWAFSSQLLKPGTAIFDDWEEIKITKGTPQGGCLSPFFFIISFDFILKQKGAIAFKMLKDGKVLAFADDILISVYPNEIKEIYQFIKQFKVFGLSTNQLKCCYLASYPIPELDKLGQYQTSIKYLGAKLTFNKIEQIKNIKNSIKKNALKLRKFNFTLPTVTSSTMEQALYKSLALYHLGPAIIVNEINFEDAQRIVKSIESKIRAIPAWCNSELFQLINPNELTISWIKRTLMKKMENLKTNQHIGTETSRWWWSKSIMIKYTGWMLWRQGYKLNLFEIRRLLDSNVLRIIMQVNKNIFYDIDRDKQYKYICPCSKIWSSNHRLICATCPVSQLRIFSIRNHEIYYSKGPFDVDKYIADIETAKDKIKNLRKLEINQITDNMWDNYKPQKINLETTYSWIRKKIELTMRIKGADFIEEGDEYKLFEDLCVDKESKIFIPIHLGLDNCLINEYPKSTYFISPVQ